MRIVILGGGPAGLYCGLLLKKRTPAHEVTVIERNAPDVTYGWGVVLSDRAQQAFQQADPQTYAQMTRESVPWSAIDVHYRETVIRSRGHVFASIARNSLLHILQQRCLELGVQLQFGRYVHDLQTLEHYRSAYDIVIGADGIHSAVRIAYAAFFQPCVVPGRACYIWLGIPRVFETFSFLFQENQHGVFQAHAFPFSTSASTIVVECDEMSWKNAGLQAASEAESLRYCEQLFASFLQGSTLLSNRSQWTHFPALHNRNWHHQNIVLLGDAAHSVHFSIGSGTILAMEDAIALEAALAQESDLESALQAYEGARRPIIALFQRASQESQTYFESIKRYFHLEPVPFAFQLLTRSGRISYEDLRVRDAEFVALVDRWYAEHPSYR